jgi:hypothetical protein
MMKLILRMTKDGRLIYGIGLWYRVFYLFFLSVLIMGAFSYSREPGFTLWGAPLFFALVLFTAGTYRESWTFDRARGSMTYRFGMLFIYRKRTRSLDDIESFTLSHFRKGAKGLRPVVKSRANRLYTTFSVVMTDGDVYPIEIIRLKRSAGRTEQAAAAIARYCEVPLMKEDDLGGLSEEDLL